MLCFLNYYFRYFMQGLIGIRIFSLYLLFIEIMMALIF